MSKELELTCSDCDSDSVIILSRRPSGKIEEILCNDCGSVTYMDSRIHEPD